LILALAMAQAVQVSGAHAQRSASDSTPAHALFDEGKRLMAEGKFAEACPKFQESQRLEPEVATLLNLAVCYERQGRIATAWARFVEAAATAGTANQPERARFAREQASKLLPLVSKIVINVPGGDATAGLEVKRDGNPVGQPQWGVPVAIDPGEHQITASAPNRTPWTTKVVVKPNGQLLTISVPELAAIGGAAPPASSPAVPRRAPPP
jgi:tetratricopeptide (TPR) repeat protein